jgi:hypothetical protein
VNLTQPGGCNKPLRSQTTLIDNTLPHVFSCNGVLMLLAEWFLGDSVAVALSIFGFLLALQGVWLVCRALWPWRVERAADQCRRRAIASFLLGVVVSGIVVFALVLSASRLGTFGQLAAWAIGGIFLIYASIGTSGFVTHLGQRLASPADAERPWRATIRGGIAFECACLLPVVGWLGLFPASLILGCGAVTLSFFTADRQDRPANRLPAQELPSLEPAEAMS